MIEMKAKAKAKVEKPGNSNKIQIKALGARLDASRSGLADVLVREPDSDCNREFPDGFAMPKVDAEPSN